MKQIYRFDAVNPPILTEEKLIKLQMEKERKRNIIFMSLASILSILVVVLAIPVLAAESLVLAILLAIYLVVTFTGGCVVTVVFCYNRRAFI